MVAGLWSACGINKTRGHMNLIMPSKTGKLEKHQFSDTHQPFFLAVLFSLFSLLSLFSPFSSFSFNLWSFGSLGVSLHPPRPSD